MIVDDHQAERALRAGVLGYLTKQESNEKVIDSITTVRKGDRAVGLEMTKRVVALALENAWKENLIETHLLVVFATPNYIADFRIFR